MDKTIKKICLVSSAQIQYSRPPAGLAFMAGVCERNNVEYSLIDLNINFLHYAGKEVWDKCFLYTTNDLLTLPDELNEIVNKFLDQTIDQIISSGPECLAITALTLFNQQWAKKFLQRLRRCSDITTIGGGPGFGTLDAFGRDTTITFGQHLAQENLLDYYVLGEGEVIFEKFLQGSRDECGLNTKNNPETWQPQIDDLNGLAMPSYKQIDFNLYKSSYDKPVISITSSRGCVRRCSFCDVGHLWKKFRFRSGQSVADEILKHHLDTGATDFWFTDSLINGSLKQFMDLLEQLSIYKQQYPSLEKLTYSGQFIIRPQGSHPVRMFELMKETGCNQIQVGIESGSESVRNHIGKKFSNADIDYHFKMCEKYKIKNWLLMLVGYPTETEQDFADSLNMLTRYQKYIINDTAFGVQATGPTAILPNTPLSSQQNELGIVYEHEGSINLWTSTVNTTLSFNERQLRWIRLIEHAVKLGYNLPAEIDMYVTTNRLSVLSNNENQTVKTKKVIPIHITSSAMYS